MKRGQVAQVPTGAAVLFDALKRAPEVHGHYQEPVQSRQGCFHLQIDRSLGAKPQTVQTHGKAKQQQILLIWNWNEPLFTCQ